MYLVPENLFTKYKKEPNTHLVNQAENAHEVAKF